jgi:hypothetical protein
MQTQWYGLYMYVRLNGLILDESIMTMDGMQDALTFHLNKLNKD